LDYPWINSDARRYPPKRQFNPARAIFSVKVLPAPAPTHKYSILALRLGVNPYSMPAGQYFPIQNLHCQSSDAKSSRSSEPGDRQIVLAVDHRFALGHAALVSAPSKKSFSSVSSPISPLTAAGATFALKAGK